MLNVLLLDLVKKTSEESIISIVDDLYKQRELPIKRVLSYSNISSFLNDYSEIIAVNINVLMVSIDRIDHSVMDSVFNLRELKPNMYIVFFIDKKIEISQIVKPSIRVSGILFIPIEKEKLSQVIVEIYKDLMSVKNHRLDTFPIKTGVDYYFVDINTIRYFEAKGKKIALNTINQEILFYSNFDVIISCLPKWFLRCHKGFIVNTKLIRKTSFSEMLIELQDGCIVPISRTFKDPLKELIEEKWSN